jgi:hypothetical protein
MSEPPPAPTPAGADAVADRRWGQVREIALAIGRLEAAERGRDLTDDEQMSLARLRIEAERASARAVLADELADRIASAERAKRTPSGG